MSLSSRFALDRGGDIGWQFLRPSQRMADPRHFQLPRGDLTSGLSVGVLCRALMRIPRIVITSSRPS
jgi:hypothetical protein